MDLHPTAAGKSAFQKPNTFTKLLFPYAVNIITRAFWPSTQGLVPLFVGKEQARPDRHNGHKAAGGTNRFTYKHSQ